MGHLIHRQILEINAESEHDAAAAQDAIARAYYHHWQSVIAETFDQLDPGTPVHIDRLEVTIDLSDIPDGGTIETLKLCDALRSALEKCGLARQASDSGQLTTGPGGIQAEAGSGPSVLSSPASGTPMNEEEAVIAFLQTGRVRWEQFGNDQMIDWINECLTKDERSSIFRGFPMEQNERTIQRLMQVISRDTWSFIVKELMHSRISGIEEMQRLVKEAIMRYSSESENAVVHVSGLEGYLRKWLLVRYLDFRSPGSTVAKISPAEFVNWLITIIAAQHNVDHSAVPALSRYVFDQFDGIASIPAIIEAAPLLEDPAPGSHVISQQVRHSEPAGDDPIFVHHAGSMLLWPYIIPMFKAYGWVGDSGWTAPGAQQSAIQMLHVLCTGHQAKNESDSAVFKCLCGLHPDDVFDDSTTLTEEQIDEAGVLLTNVLKNWSALKSGSIAALRETFLQRPGMLISTEQGWLVRIERQSFDILLDRLPWTLSVVKVPWNDYLIQVEW